MKRGIILWALLVMAGMFMASPSAEGQAYSGKALYQLYTPSGSPADVIFGNGHNAEAGQMVANYIYSDGNSHAYLYTSTGAIVDLNPTNLSGISLSSVSAIDGSQQVGLVNGPGTSGAVLWNGSPDSAVSLGPGEAFGTDGTQQVGQGADGGAILWNGSATSAVDLTPTNPYLAFTSSCAVDTNGTTQVGYGQLAGENHALLWHGTAASAVALDPTNLGFTTSEAVGVGGNQEVGWAQKSGFMPSAILWTGTADSAVNLQPPNTTYSYANDTNGIVQVGDAGGGSLGGTFDQAFLWYGTAASAVNLNNLLPSPGPWLESEALTVDANGNIFGFAIGTYDNSYGIYAVEWSVPEPASASLLLLAAPVMLMRRRKKPQTQHRRILLLEPI
ncbi:MAG: PEP-CTERM sorting domain-containing protein [Tepidisphaeraceae bacterium]